MSITESNRKGSIAETAVAFEAQKLGIPVLWPLTEHLRYDLGLELGGRLCRVQCKWASLEGDIVAIRIRTSRRGPNGFVTSVYSADEIDWIAAYCDALNRCFLIPVDVIDGRGSLHLRLAPPRNGQRAALHFADDYDFGAVAQLEVAPAWHAGGQGFESPQLHSEADQASTLTEVGAHEFRNHFGYYMEQAAAGAEILVRRRGKPYVRMAGAGSDVAVGQGTLLAA